MNGEVSLENRLIYTKYHRKLDFHARWCACGAWLTADDPVVVIVRAGFIAHFHSHFRVRLRLPMLG